MLPRSGVTPISMEYYTRCMEDLISLRSGYLVSLFSVLNTSRTLAESVVDTYLLATISDERTSGASVLDLYSFAELNSGGLPLRQRPSRYAQEINYTGHPSRAPETSYQQDRHEGGAGSASMVRR